MKALTTLTNFCLPALEIMAGQRSLTAEYCKMIVEKQLRTISLTGHILKSQHYFPSYFILTFIFVCLQH